MKLVMKRSAVIALPLLAAALILLWLPSQTFAQRRGSGGGGEQAEGSATPAAADTAVPPGNPESGKKLWAKVGCYQCHGYSAQGGSAGVRLVPNILPFAALVKYVRAPKGEMPPYTSKVISEAQLADIYAFLKSIPAPPNAKDIPMLNQ